METKKGTEDLVALMKTVKNITPENPKEAAKIFILPYFVAESYLHILLARNWKEETIDFAARYENKKITITKFYGVPVMEVFEVEEVLSEFVHDLIRLYSKPCQ